MKKKLTIATLRKEASQFSVEESKHNEPLLYGVTDGKAVGTYLEHKFQSYLHKYYEYIEGSSAKGIDFPELLVDMKVTSIKQPQSSCPFKSANQKIYGLGYSLLVFVYQKTDCPDDKTAKLNILHTVFVTAERTADYQTTTGLRKILENNGNKDDIQAFLLERMLPVDEIGASALSEEILSNKPEIGYLTISNALQWRLQYNRIIKEAGNVKGILKVK
ncbi:MAG: restriction endonuclease [Phycisphaerae bacterium]|nr:restriction endonuclease [Phycisphaerae bacterium]